MVGSTKRCLRKVLGRSQLDEEGLSTILATIEAALHSGPITEDLDTGEILTPSHVLIRKRLTAIPQGPEPAPVTNLTKQFRIKQKMTADFCQRWKKEYLLQLRNYHEVNTPRKGQHPPRIGDIVLLQEDIRPRHIWKKGRIVELRQGRDGKIRTVILQQSDGTRISRPVQLVIPTRSTRVGRILRTDILITCAIYGDFHVACCVIVFFFVRRVAPRSVNVKFLSFVYL